MSGCGGGVFHETIEDPFIHEPKGHSTAAVHSSMASRGDGTTFWRRDAAETFTPLAAQTEFELATTPLVDDYFAVLVNGHDHTEEFGLVGTALTYLGAAFTLETTDRIEVRYRF